jgi:signal transduction histidine kinase
LNLSLLDFHQQPFTGTDTGAIAVAMLAVMLAILAWRDREPGFQWLAASFITHAVFLAFARWLPPQGVYTNPTVSALTFAALSFMATGLATYVAMPPRWRHATLLALMAPYLALFLLDAAGWALRRPFTTLAIAHFFLGMVGIMAWAAAREPNSGHSLIALALLSMPVTVITLVLARTDPYVVRFLGQFPLILIGLTLLTVSLRRRKRELAAEVERRARAEGDLLRLNQSLEEKVRLRTMELEGMVDALASFNRSVSHDLQGPLGGMAGAALAAMRALQNGDDSVARRLLPLISREAEQSSRLLGSLLALARVGDASIQPVDVDPAQVARDAFQRLCDWSDDGAPPPAFDLGPLPWVRVDQGLLSVIFQNLLGNAIKYSRGLADARIRVSGSLGADGGVHIVVSDNGIGFDHAAAEAVFEPFRRLHGKNYDGHGVGLSIVRRAVERHGGRVWAEGRPGLGASFHFTLPRADRGA